MLDNFDMWLHLVRVCVKCCDPRVVAFLTFRQRMGYTYNYRNVHIEINSVYLKEDCIVFVFVKACLDRVHVFY